MAGMGRLQYLAYGSNLHPRRLRARVPSAVSLGVIKIDGWQLAFEKRGLDGSAKCTLRPYTGTDPLSCGRGVAYGVVYRIHAEQRSLLDSAEDLGRSYLEHRLQTNDFGEVFFYRAAEGFVDPHLKPFDWYHALVLAGAQHHHLPRDYIDRIARISVVADPDRLRRKAALQTLAS
jgi:hypothetical protein